MADDIATVELWCQAEECVAIFCACIPPFAGFFKLVREWQRARSESEDKHICWRNSRNSTTGERRTPLECNNLNTRVYDGDLRLSSARRLENGAFNEVHAGTLEWPSECELLDEHYPRNAIRLQQDIWIEHVRLSSRLW